MWKQIQTIWWQIFGLSSRIPFWRRSYRSKCRRRAGHEFSPLSETWQFDRLLHGVQLPRLWRSREPLLLPALQDCAICSSVPCLHSRPLLFCFHPPAFVSKCRRMAVSMLNEPVRHETCSKRRGFPHEGQEFIHRTTLAGIICLGISRACCRWRCSWHRSASGDYLSKRWKTPLDCLTDITLQRVTAAEVLTPTGPAWDDWKAATSRGAWTEQLLHVECNNLCIRVEKADLGSGAASLPKRFATAIAARFPITSNKPCASSKQTLMSGQICNVRCSTRSECTCVCVCDFFSQTIWPSSKLEV